MIPILPMMRGRDSQGAGYFNASRGNRRHNGIDLVSNAGSTDQFSPGDAVTAIKGGRVTKLGYPYADDLSFRYVQVSDDFGFDARYFYVAPEVEVGTVVQAGDVIGMLQRLHYDGITQHCHFEVKRGPEFVDPIRWICGDS